MVGCIHIAVHANKFDSPTLILQQTLLRCRRLDL